MLLAQIMQKLSKNVYQVNDIGTGDCKVSLWMSDRRYLRLSVGDLTVRLCLICRVRGLQHADSYFNLIPKQMKDYQTYAALLNCYVETKSIEKAEALFQKMKELGWSNSFAFNILIKLYSNTRQHGKMEGLFQEMKETGIPPDEYTHGILMDAYATALDIKRMEEVLKTIAHAADWHVYAIAARAYVKAGFLDKALVALKRLEELAPRKNRIAYGFLLTVYADTGNKEEVYRIWNVYKSSEKAFNSMYMCMISALLKLDDLEGAESIFKEWESRFTIYDFRVANLLISAYCKKGLLNKAEALASEAIHKEGIPFPSTWACLAGGYIEGDQIMKGVEMMRKAFSAGKTWWKPSNENVNASLEYFTEQKDVETAEEFLGMVRQQIPLTREAYHGLLRTYLAARKPVSGVLDRMKEDGFDADEETDKILEKEKCSPDP